jgi:hypothetical protein
LDGHLLNDPAHWRERAEEARRGAATPADPEARQTMLEIADRYDRLAMGALIRTAKHP